MKIFKNIFKKHKKNKIKPLKPLYIGDNTTVLESIKCPLCGCEHRLLIKENSISELINIWEKLYSINPIPTDLLNQKLKHYQCTNCSINYFSPILCDSETLYHELSSRNDWYYLHEKWDYVKASEIVQRLKPLKILEIGCGFGYFIKKIRDITSYVVGSEFNECAVEYCNSLGYNITNKELTQLHDKFDMITSFQVLEHVSDLDVLFKQMINLLNDKGYILISVPNEDGYLGNVLDILNMPPHHQTRFKKETLDYIAKFYDLEFVEYHVQPLEFGGWMYYMDNVYPEINVRQSKDKIGLYRAYLMDKDKINGHSHLALFRKK